jgi:hypothetical protein
MCQGVSNSVPSKYVVVEVLLFRCPQNSVNNIFFEYLWLFYLATFGKIVSVVFDIINFIEASVL